MATPDTVILSLTIRRIREAKSPPGHLPVGEEDDMLEQRVAVEEGLVRLPDRRVPVGAAPGLDPRDLAVDGLLVLGRLDGHGPDELGVERQDTHLVPLIQEVDDRFCASTGRDRIS
jgi:hypothetical protein